MLIIFDVDGTLVGGEETDWKCFEEAFHHATGSPIPDSFFRNLPEVTAEAIVHQALPDHSVAERSEAAAKVCSEYLRRLMEAQSEAPGTFCPMPGAAATLDFLADQDGIEVAIATGDWTETIEFKLHSASIEVSRYPMATSSDCYARADIIALAAQRAGYSLEETVYVGDGVWDYRATLKLGIPFLGVGSRYREFMEMGVVHALQTLHPTEFADWFFEFATPNRRQGGRNL